MENEVKQKQIEEMAKDMLEYGMEKYPTSESVFTETNLRESFYHVFLTYAEYLINKGYCKIHEGAVIVSKKVWEEHIENWDKTTKAVEERVRKETAEKFAEMLKADVSEDNELHERLNYYLKRDYFEYIDERCKELIGETK